MLILLILAILTIGYILYELKVFNIDYKQLFKPIIENKSNYTNYKEYTEYTEYSEQNIDDDIYFESTIIEIKILYPMTYKLKILIIIN